MKNSRRTKARKAAAGVLVVLIVMTLTFIWSRSLMSQDISRKQSETVLSYVEPYVETVVGNGNITEHLLRKLAHVSEYGALGFEFALLCVLRRRVRPQPVMNALSAGLVVSVVDEALQILSERGPLVQDILLDFLGFITGAAFVLGIHAVFRLVYGRK